MRDGYITNDTSTGGIIELDVKKAITDLIVVGVLLSFALLLLNVFVPIGFTGWNKTALGDVGTTNYTIWNLLPTIAVLVIALMIVGLAIVAIYSWNEGK